jgi:hypothetical protein
MHLDGDEQCRLDHGDGRRERHWCRECDLHRRGKHGRGSDRHIAHRRTELHGQTDVTPVRLRNRSDEPECEPQLRDRHDGDRDNAVVLLMDGRSNDSWITVSPPTTGAASERRLDLRREPGAGPATGTMTIAGQTFTVTGCRAAHRTINHEPKCESQLRDR